MGRKKQEKFVPTGNKGKGRRHKMKGKSLETFTEEMHTALEGTYNFIFRLRVTGYLFIRSGKFIYTLNVITSAN